MSPADIADQLGKTNLCVCPDFLNHRTLREIQLDFESLKKTGIFKPAGTGQGIDHKVRDHIRRDTVHWIEPDARHPVQSLLWTKLEDLKTAFNRSLYLGISSIEGHYASFPKGGFYKRHLDCFQRNDDRVVSVIIYLNRDWKSSDGGRLRVYDQESYTDVDPVGGTLVCFMSRETEHEVMPSSVDRLSFAGWFKVKGAGS
ncbi:MAG: 2OG-Fe(II) oxygenase [Bdellovibrionota bacterium]